jgi:membrane protein required for colicin V production
MNGFDIAVVVVAAVLVVFGAVKGLVRILVTLGALIAAFLLASQFHIPLAGLFTDSPEGPSAALRLVAYLVIFLGVMLAGGITAFFLRTLLKAALLGWADRLAGAALGFVVAALASALLILPIVAYTPRGEQMLGGSLLAPYVAAVADLVNHLAPEELSRRYRERMEELRRHWRGEEIAGSVRGATAEGAEWV